jgi:Undecaprenyl-phosphate glucose phosphotransferase
MITKNTRTIETLHKLSDLLIIQLAWWISYYIRFSSDLFPYKGSPTLERYIKFSLLLLAISYYFLSRAGLYSSKRISPLFEELYSVMKANAISFTLFIFAGYFLSSNKISRVFIISYLIISTLLLILSKLTVRKVLRSYYQRGLNFRSVLLIGNSAKLQEYAEKLKSHPESGMKVTNWIKEESEIEKINLTEIEKENYSTIVFGVPNQSYHLISQLLNDLNNLLIDIVVLPDLSHSFVGYQIVNMSGITAILVNEPNLSNRSVIIKRLFDIVCCGLGLLVISPFLAIIALLVKFTSKGPILYSQIRMGIDGKEFKMYKFRSMRTDSTNKETWTVKDDPRVTSIGKILRKTSLDEFPQLFNVILGDMSLVGPRPERPVFVNEFKKDIPTYMLRHKMKAGITGWAQVNGWRGDTSIEKRIECDLYYIKNWSIWLDIWIIFLTFWKGFINKNAY